MSRRIDHASLIKQAKTMAQLIEGNEENLGAYIALIKQHQPRTLRAAVIATLLRKHWPEGKGVLRKPGRYYTRRVQQFQHAIPELILSLLHTYEQASYEEIDAAMGTQAHTQAHTQAARQEPGTSARQGTIRLKRGVPMCKATAEAPARRIPQEDSSVQVRGLYQEDGIYAVRVYIAPVEYLFASIEDWECYHAQMQLLEQEESA